MTSPIFKKICELFTEFGPILAWILLEIFQGFVSADKIGVWKSGFLLIISAICYNLGDIDIHIYSFKSFFT